MPSTTAESKSGSVAESTSFATQLPATHVCPSPQAELTSPDELTSSDFDAALYVIGTCEPLEEIACVTAPDPLLIEQLMTQGLTFYIVVDSNAGAGTGTLEITLP